MPGPLQSAVLADEFAEEIRAAKVPGSLQRGAAALLAPVGRLAGYQASYPEYSGRRTAEARQRA